MTNDIKIQLVDTNQGFLDLKENTDIPINMAVADIKNITSRKGTFSKTIKLAGSKNNNILLNNYFDVNVIEGTFNINTLQKCIVLENNIPIVENAYLQLIAVNKIQSTNQHDALVEYDVVIKNNASDFFTKIGNGELTDLDFSGYDHTYNSTNVTASFSNDYTDVYKYVMPYNFSAYDYNLKEWLPGIYAIQYWDRIFSNAGYEYEWTSLASDNIRFDKLIIPYNGDSPKLTEEEQILYKVIADLSAPDTITFTPPVGNPSSFSDQIIIDNEIQDNNNDYDPVLGEYDTPLYVASSNLINIKVDIDFDVILTNTNLLTATLTQTSGQPSLVGRLRVTPMLFIRKNGNPYMQKALTGTVPAYFTLDEGSTLPNGDTTIYSGNIIIDQPCNNLIPGDILTTEIGLFIEQANANAPVSYKNGSTLIQVNEKIVVNNLTMTIDPGINTFSFGTNITLNSFIPKKIKQSDFIKSIIQMYNLYIDVDKTNPNKLLITTRDDYYDAGTITNWTKKLNKEKDQNIQFLPDLTSKKVILTYKEDPSDLVQTGYKETVNEIYGQQEFTFDNEYIKGVETKELIFSPTPVDRTSFGAIAPYINGAAPKNNIRILYDGGIFSCGLYAIIDYPGTLTQNTTYPLFSHFDLPENPTFDINFGICDYYFYNNYGTLTNNNLYNLHWRRTLNQINSNKLLTAYFDLNANDIHDLNLNAKIRIDNSYWNINKIIDYNPNVPGPTKVELISIDDELALAPFKTRPNINIYVGDNAAAMRFKMEQRRFDVNNVLAAPNDVQGINNYISPDSFGSIIRGDNNDIQTRSVMVLGYNNQVIDSANNSIVLGDDNIVTQPNSIYAESIFASEGIIGNNSLSITYADLATLKAAEELIPSQIYYITDKDIYLQATSISSLSSQGIRNQWVVKDSLYTPNTVAGTPNLVYTGIYGQGITAGSYPVSDGTNEYYAIWGGQLWIRLTVGTDGAPVDNITLDPTSWILVTPSTTTNDYRSFTISYDFEYDFVWTQEDWKGNKLHFDFGLVYDLKYNDWGSETIYENHSSNILNNYIDSTTTANIFYNNIIGLILNNSNTDIIGYNSNIGSIALNSNDGSITYNSNNGDIYDNSNVGIIYNNSNNGYIYGNSNTGSIDNNSNNNYISFNSNTSFIRNNSNDGFIYNNSNTGFIRENSNTGDISNNANANIGNNANAGDIDSNTSNVAVITENSNAGSISNNDISASITKNSNLGSINNNTSNITSIDQNSNTGNIGSNSNVGIIRDNSNTGNILGNSNNGGIIENSNNSNIETNSNDGSITRNSNTGIIIDNTFNGAITLNENNGDISFNTSTGANTMSITYNVNNGDITYNNNTANITINNNNNNGYIGLPGGPAVNRGANITGVIVNL